MSNIALQIERVSSGAVAVNANVIFENMFFCQEILATILQQVK